jgi:hypothetical protein
VGRAVVGAGHGTHVGRVVGPGDGCDVGASDGWTVVGAGVGPGDGWKSTKKSAFAAVVDAAKSVRCVHAQVTPAAVDATTAQPSEDQLLVALSQNEHAAVLAGQLTVISSGRLADVAFIVDPSGSVTSWDSPQSKVVGTLQSKIRTWDRLKHVSVRVPGS